MKSFSVTPADLETLGASSLWVYRSQIETPFILHPSKPKTDSVICCRALFNQGRQQLDYAYFIIMDTAEFSDMLISSYLNTEISGYLVLPDGMVIASSKPVSPADISVLFVYLEREKL